MSERTSNGTDRALLTEILLIAGLFATAVYLYWQPAADGALSPRWWHWMVLGLLFFGVVGFHMWRRRRGSRQALRESIREERAGE
ncbi:MAG: hypothetical protein WD737_11205 [Gemmatimonadota bacterium]